MTFPRKNWSGTLTYSTAKLLEPTTVAQVQDAVRSLQHVRPLGSCHSFNAIADSHPAPTSAQISTLRLTDVAIDRKAGTVTVGAGIRYGDLAVQLDREGLALHNLASLPHITVAGSVATGTHGSGLRNGSLATQVTAVEFVAADGSLHTLSRAANPQTFPGAVVALGALGILTHLTLSVEPSYQIAQLVYQNLPFAALEQHAAQIFSAGYSVSLFTDWQHSRADTVWIKRRLTSGIPLPAPAPLFRGATLATRKLHPIPEHPADACTDQLSAAGPWFERLPHFRMDFTPSSGAEIQTEWFIPFEHAYAAIRALENLRHDLAPHLLVSELRAVAADDLWLSMAYERRSLAIHFTWRPHPEAVLALSARIEAALAPFAPRPHWGKVFTLDAPALARVYPRLNDFRVLAARFDPHGKFRNAFLTHHLFGLTRAPVRP